MKQLSTALKTTYKQLANIPFIFILIAIAVYFWINGPAHFPYWDASYSSLIMIYIIMMLIFLVWAKRQQITEIKQPVQKSAFSFVGFFFLTWILMFAVVKAGWITPAEFPMELFWQTIILQICVVATAEELMFRGVLLSYVGVIIQAILFAIWHSYAYQIIWYEVTLETFNWYVLLFAFAMGVILGIVAKNKQWGGISATIAIHSVWNLTIIGVLAIT
jgi:membrane protease YdiL (CAAX protease family)